MAEVTVSINGRSYVIACDDGQETHVGKLAAYVDERVREMAVVAGARGGDALLLLMVSLMTVDELIDAQTEIDRLTAEAKERDAAGRESARAVDASLTDGISRLAARIESVAERLSAA